MKLRLQSLSLLKMLMQKRLITTLYLVYWPCLIAVFGLLAMFNHSPVFRLLAMFNHYPVFCSLAMFNHYPVFGSLAMFNHYPVFGLLAMFNHCIWFISHV